MSDGVIVVLALVVINMSIRNIRRLWRVATMTIPNVNDIMKYEQGEMDEDETVAFFQSLVDSGAVWQLQGHYGRVARNMLDAGLLVDKDKE